jgi:transposase
MEAYSLDLRERIVAACDEGTMTRGEVAEAFGVGRWFVQKLLRQLHGTGSLAPLPRGRGPEPLLGEAELKALRGLSKGHRDATLDELRLALEDKGWPAVSRPTLCRALKGLGLPLKKSRSGPRNSRRRA